MYDLNRFIEKQKEFYETALVEIKSGRKDSHWMWFVFPQLKGLGETSISNYYGIDGIAEAREYYNNALLKKNLIEISKALLLIEGKDIDYILGYPDNLKLKSCMTLFELVDSENEVFKAVLEKYYSGRRDEKTIELIKDNYSLKYSI